MSSDTYRIFRSQSEGTVELRISNWSVRTVNATVPIELVNVQVDDAGVPVEVSAVVAMDRFDTGHDKRDRHVHSADFLDVETHRAATFTSTNITPDGERGWTLDGSLVIAGTERPVTVSVTTERSRADSVHVTGRAVVSRSEFGVSKMPNFVIGDRIDVTATAELSEH